MVTGATCGEPSTCWVPPVEMERMEQLLWGGTFGEGTGLLRGGLSEGEQNTARGYFAKLQIPGLILVLVGIGGVGRACNLVF